MVDPDIELAGDAVDQPGSSLRRRRNPLLLALATLLVFGGAAAFVVGLLQLIDEAGPREDQALARGTVAALGERPEAKIFDHRGPVTVWIEISGNESFSDVEVAGTSCRLTSENSISEVQGNVQTSSLEIGKWATIGEADTSGQTLVACTRVEWGRQETRDRLEEETAFLIESGTADDGLGGLWLLIPGLFAFLAGIPVFFWWRSGTVGPRN